eukprot:TRINITY_DN3430_c0_g1_i1.p1 TRINITY_DN3430_c0_g1~~TRINITY_DN3430_c0_g1_i1.p1  ORF type:complete len:587 (-),score=137.33 TRINITY_DN3430_c0_g1_i1:159-1889(-)
MASFSGATTQRSPFPNPALEAAALLAHSTSSRRIHARKCLAKLAGSASCSLLAAHSLSGKSASSSCPNRGRKVLAVSMPVADLEASAVGTVQKFKDDFVEQLVQSLQKKRLEEKDVPEVDILGKLRFASAAAAGELKWPTSRVEEFRFTDLRPLRKAKILPTGNADIGETLGVSVPSILDADSEGNSCRLVFVDGILDKRLSNLSPQEGVIVSSIQHLSEELRQHYVNPHLGVAGGRMTSSLDLFTALNGVGARDVAVICVPAGQKVERLIHVLFVSTESSEPDSVCLSSPRLLVVAEDGSAVDVLEEHIAATPASDSQADARGAQGLREAENASYWSNPVAECVLGKNAAVRHFYIQEQSRGAFHTKRTFVVQEEGSHYILVEAELGARLSRHNWRMEQAGPDTQTEISTFCLAGARQLQDLHSSILLEHPRGQTRQLHKCIVSDSTGHGVFDGNVRVNKLAQQTDAQQLSRSLLLAARGTINVKPNLQIIADDVKCTHGAAISDLEDDQLFYFRTRGIDEKLARSALVFSFGAEVIEKLPYEGLRRRIESTVKKALETEGAMDTASTADLTRGQ